MSENNDKQNLAVINFIKSIYNKNNYIPLHEPRFVGNERKYLNECIDSTFVSSVGKFVTQFEEKMAKYTGAKFAVATGNGTSALHISLLLADVDKDSEVITQPLTFVATCNAISYCNAKPIFIDVDRDTMGLSPTALRFFLENNTKVKNKQCVNNETGKIIKACVPMHSYGHPCRIDEIKKICDDYYIFLIEDAAESIGSKYKDKHTGTFGQLGPISFNGFLSVMGQTVLLASITGFLIAGPMSSIISNVFARFHRYINTFLMIFLVALMLWFGYTELNISMYLLVFLSSTVFGVVFRAYNVLKIIYFYIIADFVFENVLRMAYLQNIL